MYQGNKKYTNGEITVFWYPKKCIHATTCYRELIDVFNPSKRPWVNMYGAPTSEIIRVVKLCPTQALTYEYNKKESSEEQATDSSITEKNAPVARVVKNGPLILKGDFKYFDEDGKELKHQNTLSICRCGTSKNLPYCDGSHKNLDHKY